MLQVRNLAAGKKAVFLGVKATDKGKATDEAPYGWVEGCANAAVKDRYDELVLPSALSKAVPAFMMNPVLSHGHNIDGNPVTGGLPAGSVLKIWQEADGSTFHRSRWANTPEAQKTRGLYNDGDMRGFSVQFMPLDSRQPTPEELAKFPGLRIVITELDLIEIACAVVPVNQGSLTTASKSLAGVRKLAAPTEDSTMSKRKLSDEEVKQMDGMVAAYNSTAEGMSTIAMALDELRAKAGEDDDHAPRIQKIMDGHKAMTTGAKTMGDTCMALGKGFGIKGEGEPADPNAEDPNADPDADPNADPNAADDPNKEKPEDQAKALQLAFQTALKA